MDTSSSKPVMDVAPPSKLPTAQPATSAVHQAPREETIPAKAQALPAESSKPVPVEKPSPKPTRSPNQPMTHTSVVVLTVLVMVVLASLAVLVYSKSRK